MARAPQRDAVASRSCTLFHATVANSTRNSGRPSNRILTVAPMRTAAGAVGTPHSPIGLSARSAASTVTASLPDPRVALMWLAFVTTCSGKS